MIKPTVGRIVHFTAAPSDAIYRNGNQPLAALVTYVHSDTMVNLSVFDANGGHQPRTSVLLLQDDAAAPDGGYFCQWMPYQTGQAAKTDELTPKVAEVETSLDSLRGLVEVQTRALEALTIKVATLPALSVVQVAAPTVTASVPSAAQPPVAANVEPIAPPAAPVSTISDVAKGA